MLTPNSLGAHKNKWSINDIESQLDFEILHSPQRGYVEIGFLYEDSVVTEQMFETIKSIAKSSGWFCEYYYGAIYTTVVLTPLPKDNE